MLQVQKLRCEYMKNPLGVDAPHPRISWQIEADARNTMQTAYQIQVASGENFASPLWDSGKVESEQSIHVEIAGIAPEPRRRYYYRVRVWGGQGGLNEQGKLIGRDGQVGKNGPGSGGGQNGGTGQSSPDEPSDWSGSAFWETGLLAASAWEADWISAPLAQFPLNSAQSPLLRRTFTVRPKVVDARIYATSLGLYEIELNGQRVGDSYFTPGWTSYRRRLQYQTYDVTDMLREGANAVGAVIGVGWYKGSLAWQEDKCVYGDRTAFLMQLHVRYEDGSEEMIGTDGHWKASGSPILMSEIYHGETYDARLEQSGWSLPGAGDAGWHAVELVEHAKETLVAQENVPVRKIEEVRPIALITTPLGETVIDFGQNMVGWVRFTMQGRAGEEVVIQHAEVLDREGNFYTENLRSAKQTIRYTLKGEGRETFEPHFSFQGFRYIRLSGFNAPVELDDFTGIVLHSDMERTGFFQCSDPLVNQLQHNILWGLKGNFLDVPTDCPQRDERLGWTGDAQMFAATAAYLVNTAPFFGKWLRDVAADQLEHGGVPHVVPQVIEGHSSAAWGDAAVICPWVIYRSFGDKRILQRQYASMKAWVEYMRRQGDDEYLWNTGFHFGDWLGLDAKPDSYVGATDRGLIASAFYAHSTSLLAKTAQVLGNETDARVYGDLHQQIVAAFRREFVTPAGRLAVSTQTASVLVLMFGLVDGIARERAVQQLMTLLEERGFHLATGFVGTPYLNLVLSQNGQTETAYKLLLQTDYPSWLYPVTKGATTVWEHWDGIREDGSFWSRDMNSFNHYAYGAIGDWLYSCVAGINADDAKPGYKHTVIRPQPGTGLTWAEAGLESMYGRIHAEWRQGADHTMEVKIAIPANTTAAVHLPGAREAVLLEGGVHVGSAAGVSDVAETAQGVSLTVGSGEYSFSYALGEA